MKVHKYLVSMMLITDKPLEPLPPETVIMSVCGFSNELRDSLATCDKYKPPYILGDISSAILSVVKMNPEDLEKLGKETGETE